LVGLINDFDNVSNWNILKTEIVHKKTGSKFIFKGLYRNVSSIKSIEGVDIAYVEESDKVCQESWDYLIPTIRKESSEIWAVFNPNSEDDPVYDMFVKQERDNAIVRKINWSDNPHFPDVLREEMEYDRLHNPDKWSWVWEGNCRLETEAQIFRGCYSIEAFDIPDDAQFNHGMDFGFAEDPSTVIQSYVKDNILYISKEAYGLHVTIDDLPEMIRSVVPDGNWPIVADSARPDTIDYIRRHGYRNIKSSRKGKNSIIDGIERVKSFKHVVIHPRCKHTIDEFRLYSYKVNAHTGEITPVPEDKNNHIIDALRYSIELKPRVKVNISGRF
jgi:phage terminase large subunit